MFNQLLRNIRTGFEGYNKKQPSILGNVLLGKQWNQDIERFGGKILKPIPEQDYEDNNNLALQGYYNREALGELNAKTPSNFQPKTVIYPESLANAPKKRVVTSPTPTQKIVTQKPKTVTKQVLPVQTVQKQGYNPQWDFLEQNIFPLTDKAGLPRALVASQWASESGRNTNSPINNYFGLGPNIRYPNLERNVSDYILTISNILKRKGSDLSKAKDAKTILKIIQSGKTGRYEAHNPDPMTYVQDLMNTPEFRYYNQ